MIDGRARLGRLGGDAVQGSPGLRETQAAAPFPAIVDAYWEVYDAARPVLLRRQGRLVLSKALARDGERWDAEQPSYLPLVDLPYTVEPLGPWPSIEVEEQAPELRARPAAAS